MALKGIGIDIIEIERIEKAIQKNERFLKRIFTDREIEYFQKREYRSNTVAGAFAAKEAVMKVLGTGLRNFKWTDIEIIRDELGKPNVILYDGAKDIAHSKNITEIFITISHSRDYAVAQSLAI